MKCPKCGSEYEGESCPKCNQPEILVNHSEYLRRKKEWEENGRILGVPIKKEKPEESVEPEEVYIPKADVKKIKNVVNRKTEKLASQLTAGITKISNHKFGNRTLWEILKKYWLRAVAVAIICLVLVTSITKIYSLYKHYNMTMYLIGADGRICVVDSLENRVIGSSDSAIFTIDRKNFYDTPLPKELSGKTIVYSYASQQGNYFVSELYNENGEYSLYIWNKDKVINVLEGISAKEVKYISDSGKILFVDITYLYGETVSNMALYSYDVKSKEGSGLTLIEQNVKSEYLYLKGNNLVYLNNDNQLYTVNYDKLDSKRLIASQIKDIYGVSSQTDNLYNNSTDVVKSQDKDEYMIYSQNGNYFFYDIAANESKLLFASELSGMEIVYEKDQNDVYCINMNSISYGQVKKSEGAELKTIDYVNNTSDRVYLPASRDLVYVNSKGELNSFHKGQITKIRAGVSNGSLSPVRESNAFTYIAGGVQYMKSSINADELKIQEIPDGKNTAQTMLYKKHIYFITENGELKYCDLKGKNNNSLGNVSYFWIK